MGESVGKYGKKGEIRRNMGGNEEEMRLQMGEMRRKNGNLGEKR